LRADELLRRAAQALKAAGLETARLDAEVLLAHLLGDARLLLLNNLERSISGNIQRQYDALISRRAANEPVAYITGVAEFWSLPFEVSRDVLIPRPDTETLVQAALDRLSEGATDLVADLGTGSGCIGLALLSERAKIRVSGIDISGAALQIAQRNAKRLALKDRFKAEQISIFDWLQQAGQAECGKVDMIVSNPPYVSRAHYQTLAPNVRDFEPETALLADADGLAFYQAMADGAARCLTAEGWLLLEIGFDQAAAVKALLSRDFTGITVHTDLAGHDRVISAQVRC